LLVQLSIGAILVVANAVIHVVALYLISVRVRAVIAARPHPLGARTHLLLLVFATLATFASHVVQIWIWAIVYVALGEFGSLDDAVYFSIVAFTTLGFGDIIPSPDWRLMASCEAAAGMLMFGLSTAFLFQVIRDTARVSKS
jgi:hypothetical protein